MISKFRRMENKMYIRSLHSYGQQQHIKQVTY